MVVVNPIRTVLNVTFKTNESIEGAVGNNNTEVCGPKDRAVRIPKKMHWHHYILNIWLINIFKQS